MIVVLVGAPGSGKGTQAKQLAAEFGIAHLASGDLFRENVKSGTELGKLAESYMKQGLLVPDEVTIRLVLDRMSRPDCAKGVILDGFPRTVQQARALDAALVKLGRPVRVVTYIKVSEEELLRRLAGRWICRTCGASYHTVSNPPRKEGTCDLDDGPLYQREDDTVKVARKRLEVYFAETAPVIDYYRGQGRLREIDGEQSIERVFWQLSSVLQTGQRV